MIFSKSVGAVIFCRNADNKIEYLLLNHRDDYERSIEYWNFPKGTVEKGELEIETAKREITEETGLADLEFLPKFRTTERYFCRGVKLENRGKLFFKTVIFFLAQTNDREVKISNEHVGWEWLDFIGANQRLNFKQSRRILSKADKFLHDRMAKKFIPL